MTNVVKTSNETAKSYASVLTEIKETTSEIKRNKNVRPLLQTKTKLSENKTPIINNDFPSLDSRASKRKRLIEPTETPKRNFKDRVLHCGTNEANDNSLGSPVNLTRPKRISPFAHMTKSIYISRLKNDVTVDKITSYICGKISDAKLEDFALNMLVKKDQAIDQLSFISFRLRCTPEYFAVFSESSFWPKHVMIGEFIETKKKPQLGDFLGATKPNTEEETKKMETDDSSPTKNTKQNEEKNATNQS